ncbi:uncharacterized protein LOC143876676 [Tasmannia lanceolata]|uniref:uncharacterized protein LOC143876676 n=1 Tax=Tasmannia lanceolata TaxID=3420 RepID=UPI0040641C73
MICFCRPAEMKSLRLSVLFLVMLWFSVSAEHAPNDPLGKNGKVRCTLRKYPLCFLIWLSCPPQCPQNCFVDCVSCKPLCTCNMPGAVCQDPRFVGGDGITFYFHGKKDKDFCILSDQNLHINAHFIGKRNPAMTRDFTWVQSIGILFDHHKIFVGAQKTATWDNSIDRLSLSFDGEPVSLPPNEGSKWQPSGAPHVTITRTHDTNGVILEAAGNFMITASAVPITKKESKIHRYNISKDDCFAHLELGFKFYSLTDNVHGVLGQTYRPDYTSRAKLGVSNPVLGGDREFSTSNLFATNCLATRFGHGTPSKNAVEVSGGGKEYASLKCSSGINERGLVCKK